MVSALNIHVIKKANNNVSRKAMTKLPKTPGGCPRRYSTAVAKNKYHDWKIIKISEKKIIAPKTNQTGHCALFRDRKESMFSFVNKISQKKSSKIHVYAKEIRLTRKTYVTSKMKKVVMKREISMFSRRVGSLLKRRI